MTTTATSAAADILQGQADFLFPAARPYYVEPIVIREANGATVVDVDGREYLDFFGGILTTSIGHCHPEVVAAVQDQAARLGHTSTLYVTEPQVRAAATLAQLAPGRLKKTFFTNSGTEAIETAVMLARIYTGRQEIIALRHGYSGRTAMATGLTGQAPWRPVAAGISGVVHALSPYPYRSPFGDLSEEEAAERFAQDIEEVIVTCTSGRPAALLAETIQGVGGYVVPPRGYFQRAAEVIRRYGGLLIIDEVQTGFGRTGTHWFGIEHWGVEPDIMVMAKGIANGFPVGATTTRDEIAASWTAKTISTFGGNPVAMAAMNATLDLMIREAVPSRSTVRGEQLRAGLDELYQQYDWIGEVRGMGLMLALELVKDRSSKKPSPKRASALLEATKDQALLVGLGGLNGHVMRFGPSMLVTEAQVDDALERLREACRTVDRQ
jgi:alanine-glyoxylate transaminase / (R)-3-amino-2-methylpropionate-pyruvate transaminase